MSFYPKETVWKRGDYGHAKRDWSVVTKEEMTLPDYTCILPPFHPGRYFYVKRVYSKRSWNRYHILNVPLHLRDAVAINKIEDLLEAWHKVKNPIFDPMYLDYLSKLIWIWNKNSSIVHELYGEINDIKEAILITHPETDVTTPEFSALMMRTEMIAATVKREDIE